MTNFDGESVDIINTVTNTQNGRFPAGRNPTCGVITHDASRLYVTNFGSNSVSVLEPSTRQVLASIPVGVHPEQLRLSPDERYLFVLNSGSDDVTVLRTDFLRSGNALLTVIQTGARPSSIDIM